LCETTPGLSKLGEGQNSQMPVGATLFFSAVRATQFHLPRLLDDTRHRRLFDQLLADHAILAAG